VARMFVDSAIFGSSATSCVINDVSNHDAQYLMISNIAAADNLISLT
jgi:hypothetical protein